MSNRHWLGWSLGSLAVAGFVWGCQEPTKPTPVSAIRFAPGKIAYDASTPPALQGGQIIVCKDTPPGTSGLFEIDAYFLDGTNRSADVFMHSGECKVLTTSETDPTIAVLENLDDGDPGWHIVSVTKISDAGTEELPRSGTGWANAVECAIDAARGCILIFHNVPDNSPVCTDQSAMNYGGPLPCVYPPENTPCPAGSFTFTYTPGVGLHIKYDQFPAPNDNSYGTNAVGWGSHGHKFSDLVGSDHAGVQLVDGSGVVRLSFNVDYLTANTAAPSGYSSLGVTGGDGKMLVGTADGITAITSLDRNLNNINIPGLFSASHVQQFGSVNVLINSPPTDPGHTTYVNSDPTLSGWDFHDTYFVDISDAKLTSLGFNPSTWRVEPNLSQLHNSPAKACPTSGGSISATKYEVKDKQVKVTILNSGSTTAFVEALSNITWPAANGRLMQIKLDGDVLYNVATTSGPLSLGTAQLPSDPNHRKIDHGSSDVLAFIFENNASTSLSAYTGSVIVSGTPLALLPH